MLNRRHMVPTLKILVWGRRQTLKKNHFITTYIIQTTSSAVRENNGVPNWDWGRLWKWYLRGSWRMSRGLTGGQQGLRGRGGRGHLSGRRTSTCTDSSVRQKGKRGYPFSAHWSSLGWGKSWTRVMVTKEMETSEQMSVSHRELTGGYEWYKEKTWSNMKKWAGYNV